MKSVQRPVSGKSHVKNVAEEFWKSFLIHGIVIAVIFIIPICFSLIKVFILERDGVALFGACFFAAIYLGVMILCIVNYSHYHKVCLTDIQTVRLYKKNDAWIWRSYYSKFEVTVTIDGRKKEVTTGRYFTLFTFFYPGASLRKYECELVEIGYDSKRDEWVVISKQG
jgi:hypothetical protein